MNIIDAQAMGADFCWSFGDGDARACMLPRQDVRNVFSENGFDPTLIEDVDAAEAIQRAAKVVSNPKHIKIIQMERPNKDTPRAVGIYLVIPRDGESGDDIVCGARVRVATGYSVVCLPPEDRDNISACMDIGESMVTIVNQLVNNVFNRDVSQALLAIGNKMGWLSRRRNKGGCYYLNRNNAERFAKLLKSLARMTNGMARDSQFIPHITEQYDRPLTVDSWSGAARDHYTGKTEALVKDLDRLFKDGKMRDSTMEANRDKCDAILAEAMQYQQFMKGQLNPLQDRLTKIRSAFSKALAEGNEAIQSDLVAIQAMMGNRAPVQPAPVQPAPKTTKPPLREEDFDLTFDG